MPAAELYLDARTAPGMVFVSHAHSDHCSSAPRIVCTRETAAFHTLRHRRSEPTIVDFRQQIPMGNGSLELFPASHTLGSAMALIRTDAGSVLYTGDFKLRDNPFSPPTIIPQCDVLVTECTFGSPRYRFPPDAELLASLFAFIDDARASGATPLVLAYAFGKAQEALFHLTRQGYDVMVHEPVALMCDLHVELGYTFPGPGTWCRYDPAKLASHVVLTTPGTRKIFAAKIPSIRTVQLTGWSCDPRARFMYGGCDLVLPFSDHADFDDLVRTVRESGASTIYTVHGSAGFSAHLRNLGLNARHLATQQNRGLSPNRKAPAVAVVVSAPKDPVQYALELN